MKKALVAATLVACVLLGVVVGFASGGGMPSLNRLLNGPAIKTSHIGESLSFEIPDNSWDEIDTIVELTIEGDVMDIAPLKPFTRPGIPGAKASASAIYQDDPRYSAGMVLDGDPETRWATPEGTKKSWLQIDLAKETAFNGIHIEEAHAGHSSRVKKFELQKKDGETWTTFHKGNALGAHFKASFDPVITNATMPQTTRISISVKAPRVPVPDPASRLGPRGP